MHLLQGQVQGQEGQFAVVSETTDKHAADNEEKTLPFRISRLRNNLQLSLQARATKQKSDGMGIR